MATIRTFNASEVLNFLSTLANQGGNADDWTITDTDFANILLTNIAQDLTIPSGNAGGTALGTLSGDWDFASFPAIPANAQITNVRLRYASSAIGSASASHDVGPIGCDTNVIITLDDTSGNPFLFKSISATDSDSGTLAANSSASVIETLTTSVLEYDFSGSPLTLSDLITMFGTISLDVLAAVGAAASGNFATTVSNCQVNGFFNITALEIVVTYEDGGFQFEIENPSTPRKVGEKVVIRSVDNGGGLNGATGVRFDTGSGPACIVPLIDFFFQSPNELIIYVPNCLHNFAGTVTVTVIGDGTVFVGSILAGTLPILFADGSGIYTIQKGKTSDTLYDPARDGSTEEVKIQDPYARTGYVGG